MVGGDRRFPSRLLVPLVRTLHVRPDPLQAPPACRPRAGRRSRVHHDHECRAGLAGRPRHRQVVRGPGWLRLPRTPARRCSTATSGSPPARRSPASGCPPWSTAPRTRPTRVAAQAQLDLTTAYNVAACQPVPPQRPHGHRSRQPRASGRRLPLHHLRAAHRRRSRSTPRATPTRSSSSRSARR